MKNSKIIHTLERGMWYDGSMNRRRVSISGFLLSFFPLLYDFSPERCRSVRKSTNVAVPCVGAFLLWQNWDCAVLRGAIFSLRPPVAISFAVRFLPAALLFQRPSGTPSFDARRKIGEKGVSRGCGPLNPRSNVLGHSDVLCAYLFPPGDFLRARNGAFDAIKSAAALALIPLPLRAAPRRRGFSIAVGSALGVRCLER